MFDPRVFDVRVFDTDREPDPPKFWQPPPKIPPRLGMSRR